MKNRFLFTSAFIVLFTLLSQLANAQTVYVTEKGKKYHKKNCSVVSEGKKGKDLSEAIKSGYDPCAVCKPDAAKKQQATEPKKKK
jgi:methylphosphotriester-DNA--protein-cysteine methyltransferase